MSVTWAVSSAREAKSLEGSATPTPVIPAHYFSKNANGINVALWALIVLYLVSRVLQVYPGKVPFVGIVAWHVLPPAFFAVIHGARRYGYRGELIFVVLFLVIGNVVENVGVLTGFPFGEHYFTDRLGPKLFTVPILLGLAYLGMGYLSWTLACMILGSNRNPTAGARVVTLPVVASFIMVSWDLAMDPAWSTVMHCWIWPHGGGYFGVPVSNFFGWYFAVYVFYQSFAVILRTRAFDIPKDAGALPPGYWKLAVLFYTVSAAGNILLTIPHPGPSVVVDAAGVPWRVSDIAGTCALVSIFTMGAFAALAWAKLPDRNTERLGVSVEGSDGT